MPMQAERFCAFILTHGRPDNVYTVDSLRRHGYTGRIVIVIDNEDKHAKQYRKRYGKLVVEFDKAGIAKRIDEGDNFGDRRAILYARNACFEIARDLGIETFIQLDDDYIDFTHKRDALQQYINGRAIRDLDAVFDALVAYFHSMPQALSIAMSQTGDFPGGDLCTSRYKPSRKAMNSFICSTSRPFQFVGRINEDVNTYTTLSSRGGLFLTIKDVCLQQRPTQSNAGGMTEMYLASGTYVKSFYTVMFQPSSVKVGMVVSCNRLHHVVRWRNTAPCILAPHHRKPLAIAA
jgi:TET-Associated Glycosyltransferase